MKLSPEKQKHLALTLLVVVTVMIGLWYFAINGQKVAEKRNKKTLVQLKEKVEKYEKDIRKEKNDRDQAKSYQAMIDQYEGQMPPKGNPETWLVKTLSDLATQQKIQILNTTIQPISELSDFKFKKQPYKLVGFRFEFNGEFNQIGKFLENLENNIPLMEVDDLSITSGSPSARHIHTVAIRVSMVTK